MVVNKTGRAGGAPRTWELPQHACQCHCLAQKDIPDYDANDPHVGLVHRIDKDTSGLLEVTKTPDARPISVFGSSTRPPNAVYRALVWGNVEQDEGTIIGR